VVHMAGKSLEALRRAAKGCRDCPLWAHATQTVFGEGAARARLVLVGEQPGDAEDREGHPFVGPAGHILDQALQEAGIERRTVYVTNAVKHFKWEPRGKRRLHKTPAQREIEACHQWLEGELAAVKPALIVALGATAENVRRMIIWEGMRLVAIGVVLGGAVSFWLAGRVAGMLFLDSARDAVTFTVIPPALVLAGMAACWIPARRSTRIDPSAALRNE